MSSSAAKGSAAKAKAASVGDVVGSVNAAADAPVSDIASPASSAAAKHEALRALPSVEEVLEELDALVPDSTLPRELVVDAVRDAIDEGRSRILAGEDYTPSVDAAVSGALARLQSHFKPSLRRVINATGVIVHTNLGRSALAPEAIDAVTEAARGYSTLEYDTKTMERGSRHVHCEGMLCALTKAEAAIAVNNNAAAVMMVLSEFAAGREAVISRGELIEIGGSFRIPDIMDYSHAQMVEVGTTNKTHLSDYERAIGPDTAMLLKVHTSNYRLVGFTESVEARELKKLADAENARRAPGQVPILVYEDLGSGLILPIEGFGDYGEPTVAEAVKQGCDLVSFSGDKLLGGPQVGIIVGKKELIDRLKKNPLARALRLDKMTLAALEATLRLYLDPELARREIPTLRMLSLTAEEARTKAQSLARSIKRAVPKGSCAVSVVDDVARSGGGSLPMFDIPSAAVELDFAEGCAQDCMAYLVQQRPVPVIGRIKHETLLFDVRTLVDDSEQGEIAEAVAAYFKHLEDSQGGDATA